MFSSSYFLSHTGDRHALHSFPTRRSSDLVVAHRADTFRSRQQKRFLVRGIVTHAYFIEDQRMRHAIGAALWKDTIPHKLRANRANRSGGQISQRGPSLNPTATRHVARGGP